MKSKQVTVWDKPQNTINTSKGNVKYSDWLENEKARHETVGGVFEIKPKGLMVALFRVK